MAFKDKNLLEIIADLVKRVRIIEQTPFSIFVLPNNASAPSSPKNGQCYFNTTTNKAQCYDGTTWNNLW